MATKPPPAASLSYAGYANYVAQTLLADATGSPGDHLPANPLATAGLDTAILVDPAKIAAYRESIASQMNVQSAGPRFSDLSDRIADVIIETKVQGAGTLEVHLIDPLWVIPLSGFIKVDVNGYLWPPIDVNFPSGTKCVWRLCQFKASWQSTTDANLILTFEDRIVSQLREISPGNGGLVQGLPNQTLGGFIKMLVDNTNTQLHSDIQLLELISPQDPNYTLPVTQTTTPSHLKSKLSKGLTGQMQQLLNNLDANQLGAFPHAGTHGLGTIAGSEKSLVQQWKATGHALELNQGYIPGLGISAPQP
jgi:hypothetical protein